MERPPIPEMLFDCRSTCLASVYYRPLPNAAALLFPIAKCEASIVLFFPEKATMPLGFG